MVTMVTEEGEMVDDSVIGTWERGMAFDWEAVT